MRSNDWNLQLDIFDLVLRCNLIAVRVMTYWNSSSWKVAALVLRNLPPKSDIVLENSIWGGWRSRGWQRHKGRGWDQAGFYLGFRAGNVSITPGITVLPCPRTRTLPTMLSAPSPAPQQAQSSISSGPGRRDSELECPLLPGRNQNLFCRNPLRLKPYPLLEKWSVYGSLWKYFPLKGHKSWNFLSVFPSFPPFGQSKPLFGEQGAPELTLWPSGKGERGRTNPVGAGSTWHTYYIVYINIIHIYTSCICIYYVFTLYIV